MYYFFYFSSFSRFACIFYVIHLSNTSKETYDYNPHIFSFALVVYGMIFALETIRKSLTSTWKKYVYLWHLKFCLKCSLRGEVLLVSQVNHQKPKEDLSRYSFRVMGYLSRGTFWMCDLWHSLHAAICVWLVTSSKYSHIYIMRHILIKWSCPSPYSQSLVH